MLMKCLLILYCTAISFTSITGFSNVVNLGCLFEKYDPLGRAFNFSVNTINSLKFDPDETNDLPEVYFESKFVHNVGIDLFDTERNVCNLLRRKIAAIFGPAEKTSAEHVQSICESVDMLNIVARWDTEPVRMKAFNFYPHIETFSQGILHLVTEFHWTTYTILYDSMESLVRMNALLKKWDPHGHAVTIRHLGTSTDFREILLEVKKSGEKNIVIDCSFDILERVLVQCLQVGLLADNFQIIVTHLDLHTIDLEPYRYSGVNFTGVRLVDVENPKAQKMFELYSKHEDLDNCDIKQLPVETALMFDAVYLFARAFKRSIDAKNGEVQRLKCDDSGHGWDYGTILGNYMRATEVRGITGLVKLNGNGFRSDFELDILRLSPKGFNKIGVYNSTRGIDWHLDEKLPFEAEKHDLHNNTFRVLIALVPPYCMLTESSSTRSGNDRYEGFAIDIIHEVSNILHFNYTFVETDPDYGKLVDVVTKKWSGMLGKVIDSEADLAITDLTITSERESAVDFTMPFMNLGISILYKKPTKAAPSLFSFLSPFSIQVWVYLMGSYVFCSLLLCVIGRMSPKEWTNPYPCLEEPEQLENQFTLKNSLWFTIGAIMQQGSEIAPIGLSTRILASSWWFFCLIIVSSYTANLAAFLVVETTVKPIKSAEDLADLNGAIKYGAKKDGSTFNFFKTIAESQGSNHSTYKKMYEYMVEHAKEVMTDNNEKGTEKVLSSNGKYAFLMESTSIQYIVERECTLSQIGGLLDAKGYGIAMRKNWVHRHKLNEAILHLQESGVISQLKQKWWEQKRGGGKCKGDEATPASKLTLDHVGGVFVVLGIGVAIAVPFACWEFIWKIGCIAHKENVSFKHEFVQELKSVAKAKGSAKPARRRAGSAGMIDSSTRGSTPAYVYHSTVITSAAEIE